MSAWWAIPMLIGGGLFAGGVVSIAWERIPAWRDADLPDFQAAFAHTLRRVDRLQPALLLVCLISTVGFALSEAARRAPLPRSPPPASWSSSSARRPGSSRSSVAWSPPERNGPRPSWRS